MFLVKTDKAACCAKHQDHFITNPGCICEEVTTSQWPPKTCTQNLMFCDDHFSLWIWNVLKMCGLNSRGNRDTNITKQIHFFFFLHPKTEIIVTKHWSSVHAKWAERDFIPSKIFILHFLFKLLNSTVLLFFYFKQINTTLY